MTTVLQSAVKGGALDAVQMLVEALDVLDNSQLKLVIRVVVFAASLLSFWRRAFPLSRIVSCSRLLADDDFTCSVLQALAWSAGKGHVLLLTTLLSHVDSGSSVVGEVLSTYANTRDNVVTADYLTCLEMLMTHITMRGVVPGKASEIRSRVFCTRSRHLHWCTLYHTWSRTRL